MKKKLLSVFLLSLTIAAVFILGACRYIGAEMSKKTISFYVGDKLYTTVRTAGQESISLPNAPDGLGEFEGWYFDEGTWRDPLTKDTYATTALKKDVNVYAYFRVVAIESVALSKQQLTLNLGTKETLAVQISPRDGSYQALRWTSSNEDVVLVSGGTVQAIGVGEAVVTLEIDGQHAAQCDVLVVNEDVAVSLVVDGVTLDTISTNYDARYRIFPRVKDAYFPTDNISGGKYFSGWYLDADMQTPLADDATFTTDGAIYAAWLDMDASSVKCKTVGGHYTLTDCSLHTEAMILPAVHSGRQIERIGQSALRLVYYGNIHIPATVSGIEEGAITAPSLYALTLPFVGAKANPQGQETRYPFGYIFGTQQTGDNYTKVQQRYYTTDSADSTRTYYSLPKTLSEVTVCAGDIGYGAFQNCELLSSIHLPASLAEIGDYAFDNCGIAHIDIPDGVTVIGEHAFYDCKHLTEIALPDGLQQVGGGAFGRCSALTAIAFPDSVQIIRGAVLSECTSLSSVTLPAIADMELYAYSLRGCTSLETLVLPTAYYLQGEVFPDCSALRQIVIPAGTYIDNARGNPFKGCYSLSIFVLGEETDLIIGKAGWNSVSGTAKAPVYYYRDSEPQESGNYWHYVDGAIAVWE